MGSPSALHHARKTGGRERGWLERCHDAHDETTKQLFWSLQVEATWSWGVDQDFRRRNKHDRSPGRNQNSWWDWTMETSGDRVVHEIWCETSSTTAPDASRLGSIHFLPNKIQTPQTKNETASPSRTLQMIVWVRQMAAVVVVVVVVVPVDTSLSWRFSNQKNLRPIFQSDCATCKAHWHLFGCDNSGRTMPLGTNWACLTQLYLHFFFNIILPQIESNHAPSVHCRISKSLSFSTIEVIIVHGMFLLSCRIKILGKICDRQRFFWSTRSLYCSGVVWGRYTRLIVPEDLFWKRVFQTSFLCQIVVKSLAWFKRLWMIFCHALVPLPCPFVRCRKNFYWRKAWLRVSPLCKILDCHLRSW